MKQKKTEVTPINSRKRQLPPWLINIALENLNNTARQKNELIAKKIKVCFTGVWTT